MLVEEIQNNLADFRRLKRLSAMTGTGDDMQGRRDADGR
jgi:hypothetical protein